MKNIAKKRLLWDSIQCDERLAEKIHDNDNYQEAVGRLLLGEYKALNLEKLHNYGNVYSVRVKGSDKADRLLFTYEKGKKEALILSVADKHDYKTALKEANAKLSGLDQIAFVNAADAKYEIEPNDENLLDDLPADVEDLFGHLIDYNEHLIPLSSQQYQASITLPLIINGIAGSGKTLVAQDVLMSVEDEVEGEERVSYYFAPTQDLIDTMTKSIKALPNGEALIKKGQVVVTTFEDYAKKQLEIVGRDDAVVGFKAFQDWYHGPKGSKSHEFKQNIIGQNYTDKQIYSEICRASIYKKSEYVVLGKNESLFAGPLTEKAWNIKKLYDQELVNKNNFDPNLTPLPTPEQLVNDVDQDRFWQWYGDCEKSNEEEAHLAVLEGQRRLNIYDLVCSANVDEKDAPVILGDQKRLFSELSREEQEVIGKFRQEYLQFLEGNNEQDEVLMRIVAKKNRVIVDEFQSASPLLLQAAKNLSDENAVIYMGDHAQSILTSVPNTNVVRKLFGPIPIGEETWLHSYRCPTIVMEAASKILDLKQKWTGEKKIRRDETVNEKEAAEIDEKEGNLYFYRGKSVPEIARTIIGNKSSNTVIIVPNEALKQEARDRFGTGFVVTPADYIGMESKNVVMYRCFEKKASQDLVTRINKATELDKTSINELFVAMTRETESLTICEARADKNFDLFGSLGFFDLKNETAIDTFSNAVSVEEEELIQRVKDLIATDDYEAAKEIIQGHDESVLFANINDFIKKGNHEVARSIILYDICDREVEKSDKLMNKMLGIEEIAQEQESASVARQAAAKKKGGKGKNKKPKSEEQLANDAGTKAKEEAPRPVETVASTQDIVRKIKKGQNNKGWFTSRASQALVGFLAVVGSGSYFSGIFGGNKSDARSDFLVSGVDDPADIFKEMDCLNNQESCAQFIEDATISGSEYYVNLLKEFGKRGYDLNIDLSDDKEKASHRAAINGHIEILKALQPYIDLGSLTVHGESPAKLAAGKGYTEIVTFLGDLGYDMESAIYAAIEYKEKGVIGVLRHYLDYNALNEEGYSVSHIAAYFNKPESLEAILKSTPHPGEEGATKGKVDPDVVSSTGLTVAHIAADHDNPKLFEVLERSGASFSQRDDWGNTPLHTAANNGHLESFKSLWDLGDKGDVYLKNNRGDTPIDFAKQNKKVKKGDNSLVEFLDESGLIKIDKSPKTSVASSDSQKVLNNERKPGYFHSK